MLCVVSCGVALERLACSSSWLAGPQYPRHGPDGIRWHRCVCTRRAWCGWKNANKGVAVSPGVFRLEGPHSGWDCAQYKSVRGKRDLFVVWNQELWIPFLSPSMTQRISVGLFDHNMLSMCACACCAGVGVVCSCVPCCRQALMNQSVTRTSNCRMCERRRYGLFAWPSAHSIPLTNHCLSAEACCIPCEAAIWKVVLPWYGAYRRCA